MRYNRISPGTTSQGTHMQRAASLLGKLKMPAGANSAEDRARAAWAVAAGPKIARHTLAASLVRGTLVVEVSDIVWQKQLNTLRHFLLRNLAEILGEPLVTDIAFRPMPRRRAPQRAEAARATDGIADPVLALLYRKSKRKQA
jgi:predicted nucleic acid-binding Zn ribbon protein